MITGAKTRNTDLTCFLHGTLQLPLKVSSGNVGLNTQETDQIYKDIVCVVK